MSKEDKKEQENFQDVVGDLLYGDSFLTDEPEEEQDNPDDPEAEAEDKPSEDPEPDAGDEVPEDEEAEDKPEEGPEEAESDDPEPETAKDGEQQGAEADQAVEISDDEVYVIDGEKRTGAELRAERMMRADHTRKTQSLAEERRQFQESSSARSKLLQEVVEDSTFNEFVKAHPEVLPGLLEDAENTRALIGNEKEIQALWDDYELVAENPRLAKRFTTSPDQGQEEMTRERERDNVLLVANALDAAVDAAAKQYEGVSDEAVDEVKQYIIDLGRLPEDADHDATVDAFGRLYSLMFVQRDGQVVVDDTLIRGRFDLVSRKPAKGGDTPDDHNKAVDEQLSEQDTPPVTPGGSGPSATADEVEDADSFQSVVHGLLGWDG